ncbi:hypothetical protein KI387_017784, partial [Taxus chinensis]
SHDVDNNENIDSSSKILYYEIVNDTPSWVHSEVKKRKRVVKPIDIDFDALFKLSNDALLKKPTVLSRIIVDSDGNKFADLAIPQVDKERDAMTPADYEVSRLGLGRSTLKSDMEARDSIDIVLKRLEKYKSQNSQLTAENNQLVEYVQHLINPISSTFPVPDPVAAPDEDTLNLSKEINTLGHVTKTWLLEILVLGQGTIKTAIKLHEDVNVYLDPILSFKETFVSTISN